MCIAIYSVAQVGRQPPPAKVDWNKCVRDIETANRASVLEAASGALGFAYAHGKDAPRSVVANNWLMNEWGGTCRDC